MTAPSQLADAYERCEAITRTQAANFYYGIRLLPGDRRRAMCAVYAFARRIDDIGDGSLARQDKLDGLEVEQRALGSIAQPRGGDGAGQDAVIVALADAYERFPIPHDALDALIEGVRMDVEGASYETFDELVVYCRRVAGAIGRACLAIFGLRREAGGDRAHAEALADDLGVALQLTNILRDLREDAHNGRVYLPAEDLDSFAILPTTTGARSDGDAAAQLLDALARADSPNGTGDEQAERVAALVRFESQRARGWFDRGIALTDLLDRRSTACVLAMAGIYARLLSRIEEDPLEAVRHRISLPAAEKAWVAARGLLGVRA